MSAPLKPWETGTTTPSSLAMPTAAGTTNAPPAATGAAVSGSGVSQPPGPGSMAGGLAGNTSPSPPAPPPRPNADPSASYGSYAGGYASPFMGRYGGMGYGVGGYGVGQYGGFGSYGGYGGYGTYGGPSGYGGGSEVARIAEDSTRSAFQSVEALVQAFSSISMMLESTYFALHSSFRAVIGVADHLSRVRDQLAQVLATLSVVRTLRWIIRKTLYILGILKDNPERAWQSAANQTVLSAGSGAGGLDLSAAVSSQDPPRSSWPVISFFTVVLGAPWLIYRMFASSGVQSSARWASGEAPHFVGVAQFDFAAESERELTFRAGSKIRLAPKNLQPRVRGWLLGSVDGERTGLVPANYVKIIGPSQGALAAAAPGPSPSSALPSPPSLAPYSRPSDISLPSSSTQQPQQQHEASPTSLSPTSPSSPTSKQQQATQNNNDLMETSSTSLYNEFVQVNMSELEDARKEDGVDSPTREDL